MHDFDQIKEDSYRRYEIPANFWKENGFGINDPESEARRLIGKDFREKEARALDSIYNNGW